MLSRDVYKHIKRMNNKELTEYLQGVVNDYYTKGYSVGVSDMSKLISKRVETGIKNTPGIGEKRYNQLLEHINAELDKEVHLDD